MSILERIRELKEIGDYDRATFEEIADEIEEEISPAEMWHTLRVGFSMNELVEGLEYIARENNLKKIVHINIIIIKRGCLWV